jgi:hypothetical protein
MLIEMTSKSYREALKQAKTDLAEQVAVLGAAQDCAEKAEKAIVELRQTISALQRLCGEPEFVEEDALGLTDAIRMAFKTEGTDGKFSIGGGMSPLEVRAKMESMGYAGRWGNLLASIYTVMNRLKEKGEIKFVGNTNGRDMYAWNGARSSNAIANRLFEARLLRSVALGSVAGPVGAAVAAGLTAIAASTKPDEAPSEIEQEINEEAKRIQTTAKNVLGHSRKRD